MGEKKERDDLVSQLVTRAQRGDQEAFRSLVHHVHRRIFRWALVLTADLHDADDVAQLVLMKMYEQLGSYRAEAPFSGWLYRVTRNAAFDFQRQKETRRALFDPKDAPSGSEGRPSEPDMGMDSRRLLDLVHCFFDRLPVRQREIFDLVDLQGFSPAEVADLLEMVPSTVRANLFKARRTIRKNIILSHPEFREITA